ncbi:MAG: hypothetical protein N4A33_12675 [Bacteriovoracaceae bacterium]|nr:hypothetical protein [Bacteriovoracaceae bacterium]
MKAILLIYLLVSNFAFSQNESAFDDIGAFDADEINTSENYIHNGKSERLADEACSDTTQARTKKNGETVSNNICNNQQNAFLENDRILFGAVRGKSLESWMPMVSQIYSSVVGVLPMKYYTNSGYGKGSSRSKIKEAKTKEAKKATKKKETKSELDYCGLVGKAAEMGSGLITQAQNKQNTENLKNTSVVSAQAQAFYANANTHEALKKRSRIQGYVWSGVSACYVAMMAKSYMVPNAGAIMKASGSAFMGYFYLKKASYHKQRQEQFTAMADSMPKKGECNPVTDTTCFCAEETSQQSDPDNYQKYCMPQMISGRPGTASTCVTSTGLADPNCNCKLDNSCITTAMKNFGLKLGMDPSVLKGILQNYKPLQDGFASGNLADATNKNLAFAQKTLKKIKPQLKNSIKLNDKQKSMAKDFLGLGFPQSAAAILASLPPSQLPEDFAGGMGDDDYDDEGVEIINDNVKASYKTVKKKRSRKKSYRPSFKRKMKTTNSGTGIEIDDYLAKAQREAEITKDSSKPLFEIISYRYKKSAWKEFKNNLESEDQK